MIISFINLEEDLQYNDLLKMVSEDFLIREEGITLSYGISLYVKSMVENIPNLHRKQSPTKKSHRQE